MRTIAFTNDKGGVAKSTSVANIAVGLAHQDYTVLVIDMDQQGDATYALLGARPPMIAKDLPIPKTTYSLLTGTYSIAEVILKAPRYPNISLVPSNTDLAQAGSKLAIEPGGQTALMFSLQALAQDAFDFVLIDTGKGLDALLINSLAAADEVLILTSPGRLELDAVGRMVQHIDKVRTRVLLGADHPKLLGIVLTRANHYTVARDTKTFLEQQYAHCLLETYIPTNEDLSKAVSRAQSIFEFKPQSKGAQAYAQLIAEVFINGQ
jgi:chromosome partitioning protein